MVDPALSSSAAANAPIQGPPSPDASMAATLAISASRLPSGGIDAAGLQANLDRIATDNPAIAGYVAADVDRQLSPVERGELARARDAGAPAAANDTGPDPVQLGLDLTQLGLDIVGIVEPTPFADGSNVVISAGRAIGSLFSGNFGDAGGHAVNGVLSGAGILPYLGDAAKAGKIGKWAQTVGDAIQAVAANPALRTTFEPALQKIHDAVQSVPQGVIDKLPGSARESFDRMKAQLDEFFGAGARNADEVPSYTATVRGEQVVLSGVDAVPVNYVKRDRAEYQDLRRTFDNSVRGDFARDLVNDPAKLAELRRAGIDDVGIARLREGKIPEGYQVHHKLPLDDGGTNDFSNLVLIRNDPYHQALTNEQRRLVGDLPVGGSRQVDFPVPRGFVYPPAP